MSRAIEDELATAMRDEVGGLIPAPDIMARAARRYRRRARIRMGGSAAAAAGITAMLVAIGLPGASNGHGSPRVGRRRAGGDAA